MFALLASGEMFRCGNVDSCNISNGLVQLAMRIVQTEKDVPQPQDAVAFGFLTMK